MANYIPWPKQAIFHRSPANEILYGGAAGPGKSHALRHEALNWCMRIPGLQVYLFRRTFPELEKNHIIPSLDEFPRHLGKYKEQKKRWEFANRSMLHFAHCQYEKDVFSYHGAEIHLLLIDELTMFTEFMYDYLRARTRCALEIPEKYKHKIPGIATGSNPGGVGHAFAKMRWVDKDPHKEMKLIRAPKKEGGMLRQYIPGLLKDNPSLTVNDPTYINRLDALPEPYRTAYKDGDWNIFFGQAFNFSTTYHVVKPLPIPEFTPLYMTFDSGFGKPFSVGWWWSDPDGRLYRFSEWYGWNQTPNEGIRLTDMQITEGIIEREQKLGIKDRVLTRIGDRWCFQKRPNYMTGGQLESAQVIFMRQGIPLRPGHDDSPNSRILKIRQFHERLRLLEDRAPMIQIYENCDQFVRTIPLLQADPNNKEDLDTTMEDHVYDEACLIFMAQPIGVTKDETKEIIAKKEKKAKRDALDSLSRSAWEEVDVLKETLEREKELEETGEMW